MLPCCTVSSVTLGQHEADVAGIMGRLLYAQSLLYFDRLQPCKSSCKDVPRSLQEKLVPKEVPDLSQRPNSEFSMACWVPDRGYHSTNLDSPTSLRRHVSEGFGRLRAFRLPFRALRTPFSCLSGSWGLLPFGDGLPGSKSQRPEGVFSFQVTPTINELLWLGVEGGRDKVSRRELRLSVMTRE